MNTTPVPSREAVEAFCQRFAWTGMYADQEPLSKAVSLIHEFPQAATMLRALLAEVERLTEVHQQATANYWRATEERDEARATVAQQAEEIAGLRKVTEWLPIETAPKDGTRIHIKGPGFEMESRWKVFFREPEWEQTEMFGGFNSYEGPIHPTHWKPLKQTP